MRKDPWKSQARFRTGTSCNGQWFQFWIVSKTVFMDLEGIKAMTAPDWFCPKTLFRYHIKNLVTLAKSYPIWAFGPMETKMFRFWQRGPQWQRLAWIHVVGWFIRLHGPPWSTIVHHGVPWSTMVYHGPQLAFLKYDTFHSKKKARLPCYFWVPYWPLQHHKTKYHHLGGRLLGFSQ